jgi:UDPglucose--hexose-1-phosphate uridylyltransferase
MLPIENELSRPCPFCPGNEESTPPALESYGTEGQWLVRVVPNLYPAFEGNEPMRVTNLGPVFTQATASGIHEVLVFSPDHDGSWADLDDKHAGLAMAAIRDRMEDHARRSTVRYTQAIVNHGREAGASLDHPHGQLLGIPFVPGEIADEEAGFRRFEGSCLLCTVAEAELAADHRIVYEDDRSLVICPYWSGAPYEMLVMPREHEVHLENAGPQDVVAVGRALRTALSLLREKVRDVAYNIVFHTAPHHHDGPFHWHVHLVPRLTSTAGFEQGTGVMINIVAPELACQHLTGG